MLRGTSLEKAARDIISAAVASWEELQPVLTDGCAQHLISRELLNRQDYETCRHIFKWSGLPYRGACLTVLQNYMMLFLQVQCSVYIPTQRKAETPGNGLAMSFGGGPLPLIEVRLSGAKGLDVWRYASEASPCSCCI